MIDFSFPFQPQLGDYLERAKKPGGKPGKPGKPGNAGISTSDYHILSPQADT